MRMMLINEASLNPVIRKPTIESVIAGLLDVELLKSKAPALPKPKIAAAVTRGVFKGKCFKCHGKGHKSNDPSCPKFEKKDYKNDSTMKNDAKQTTPEVSFKQATTATGVCVPATTSQLKHSLMISKASSKASDTETTVKFI